MALVFRSPQALSSLRDNRRISLAALFGFESMARAILLAILPLQGLELFTNAKSLSDAVFVGAMFGLVLTLNISAIIKLIARRWTYVLGISMMACASLLFIVEAPKAYVVAMALRAGGTSMITICISLYVMDLISKEDFKVYEPRRLLFSAASWIIGPTLGVWLFINVGAWSPFLVSNIFALVALGYFWWLRMGPGATLQPAVQNPEHPLLAIVHFFERPKLRITYIIVLIRANFWVTLFIYSPIYIRQAGLDDIYAGLFLSTINFIVLAAPIVGLMATRLGTRNMIITAYTLLGFLMLLMALWGDPKPTGLIIWFFAALCAFCIDVLGNIPFMRLVKPKERADMTMVFSTWRDVGEVTTPGVAGLILAFMPLSGLFFVLAAASAGATALVSYLPKRL